MYDGGLKAPLIIAYFIKANKNLIGEKINIDMISGLDLGRSSLQIAGIDIPNYMEGKIWLVKRTRVFNFYWRSIRCYNR